MERTDEEVREATMRQVQPLCVWYMSKSLMDAPELHRECLELCNGYNENCEMYQRRKI